MPDRNRVFPEAQAVIRTLLREADEAAPGLILDAYVVGSIPLDDARPGHSDIDIITVRAEEADNESTVAALGPVLSRIRETHPEPVLDGIVLSRTDIASGPDHIVGDRPNIVDSTLKLSGDGSARNPVLWKTLTQCGITWHGVPIAEADIWDASDALPSWTRGNLNQYWAPWLARSDRLLCRWGAISLGTWFVEWGVPGVARLHYTLATGEITSKRCRGLRSESFSSAMAQNYPRGDAHPRRQQRDRSALSQSPCPSPRRPSVHAHGDRGCADRAASHLNDDGL